MKRNKDITITEITEIEHTEERVITEATTTEDKEMVKDNNTNQSTNKEENKDNKDNKEVTVHNLKSKFVNSEEKRSRNSKMMVSSLSVSPNQSQKTLKNKDVITTSNTVKNTISITRQETTDQ